MRRRVYWFIGLALLVMGLAACGGKQGGVLPTIAVLPSLTPGPNDSQPVATPVGSAANLPTSVPTVWLIFPTRSPG